MAILLFAAVEANAQPQAVEAATHDRAFWRGVIAQEYRMPAGEA